MNFLKPVNVASTVSPEHRAPEHRIRDRARTRGKIVAAARAEFSAKGYSGARMEQIAERAEINTELIYHYFRGKEHLFKEVCSEVRAHAEARNAIAQSPLIDRSQPPSELFAWRFQKMLADTEWIKLLTWEAAQGDVPPNEDTRRATIEEAVARIEKAQQEGWLPAGLDPRLLQLAVFALTTYPLAFSQITFMTTGMSASDERFQASWIKFLRQVGAHLFSSSPGRGAKTRSAAGRPRKRRVRARQPARAQRAFSGESQ